jgi:hypothetical protein
MNVLVVLFPVNKPLIGDSQSYCGPLYDGIEDDENIRGSKKGVLTEG